MPGKRGDERQGEVPRTDLPPEREPYYEGYFGTDEEEGVEREREEDESSGPARGESKEGAAEDAAGAGRESD
jgi:hypothetical protein